LTGTGKVMGWMKLSRTARLLGELRLDQYLRLVAPLSLVVVVDADETGEAAVDKILRFVSRGARGDCSAFASFTASISAMRTVLVAFLATVVGE
jgi:nitrogen regulatory protein PII